MNILKCKILLSKVVEIDIPEDKLGDQSPETLAQLTARSQYGFNYMTEVIEIQRVNIKSDELLDEAKRLSTEYGKVSVSYLQRALRIGYVRAARLVDILIFERFCEKERREGEGYFRLYVSSI